MPSEVAEFLPNIEEPQVGVLRQMPPRTGALRIRRNTVALEFTVCLFVLMLIVRCCWYDVEEMFLQSALLYALFFNSN